jgi:hypothetical protein
MTVEREVETVLALFSNRSLLLDAYYDQKRTKDQYVDTAVGLWAATHGRAHIPAVMLSLVTCTVGQAAQRRADSLT